jgi:Flp pilus assembly protein TadG
MRSFGDFITGFTRAEVNPPPRLSLSLPEQGESKRVRRRARQSGNAILEGALIFLPMLAFFLGIIDVSFAIFIQSTLTTATREGTRFAITYSPSFNGTSCVSSESTCINNVVQYNAVGVPNGVTTSYITVNYYTANDLANPVMACNSGTCTTSVCTVATCQLPQVLNGGTGPTITYANQPGNIVEVVIAGYPWNWLAPMPGFYAGGGITMSARSVDVLGGLPVGTTAPGP